ncbi:hypothetical protein KC19_4G262200 [Ceratodon purpureus]|uniref:Uncharacterized protein n=1 Tax=Ceratodon purpureus TaxID=3225 RepID=A0A8T0ICU1_CERPU|nr:hypothetical protein KC19_4G262200 [Ceratodon purpureus]
MGRSDRYNGRKAKQPRSAAELAPWLTAVEEWRRRSIRAVPEPRLLLDLVVPGAEWWWSVGTALQRLEMEFHSGIPYPLPPAPTEVTDSNMEDAPQVSTESATVVFPASAVASPPRAGVDDAIDSHQSCVRGRGESNRNDSNDSREDMQAVFTYLEGKYGAGESLKL